MQSPSHPGASAGAFLVLIEEDCQSPLSPSTVSPSAALHVPEFDWVQIRETWGGLRLYRHAPLDHHHNGARRRGPPPPPSHPSASPPPSRPGQGFLLRGAGLEEAGAVLAREGGGNEPEVLTPFRPARLSTVLLLDCRVPSSSSEGSSDGDGGALPSAKEILEGLSPLAPRIAFLHIVRDSGGGAGGGSGVRTSVLVTLDSVEAAEGWAAMTAEGRELSLGGQLLYVSGLVLLRRLSHPQQRAQGEEDHEDALLPCLKSLVDEVGASSAWEGAAAEQQQRGGSGSPVEYAQLGTVYVCCDEEEQERDAAAAASARLWSASCLAFGPPQDALALLSSLSLRLRRADAEEEEEEAEAGEMGAVVAAVEDEEAAATTGAAASGRDEIASPRAHAGRRNAGARSALPPAAVASRVLLSTPGLDSYLSELPTCLDCLDRIDPLVIGLGALAPPPASLHFSASAPYSSSPFLPHHLPASTAATAQQHPTTVPVSPRCVTCRLVAAHAAHQQAKSALSSTTTSSGATDASSLPLPLPPPLTCRTCAIPENLWICLLCAHVGCGRYTAEHAQAHFRSWGHSASLELATGRVWDYVEDVFVHAASHQQHHPPTYGAAAAGHAPGLLIGEVLPGHHPAPASSSSIPRADEGVGVGQEGEEEDGEKDGRGAKLAGLGAEYSALLMSQLEEQSAYYERLLAKAAAELAQGAVQEGAMSEREREEAAQARAQIERLEEEHARLMAELREAEEGARQLRARNQQLLQEQRQQMGQLKGLRKAAEEARAACQAEVEDLEAQINDLMFFLQTQEQVQNTPELAQGDLSIQQQPETRGQSARARRRRGGR